MINVSIVIKDGVLQNVFTDTTDDLNIELINMDNVSSLKEKLDNEARIRELGTESVEFQQN